MYVLTVCARRLELEPMHCSKADLRGCLQAGGSPERAAPTRMDRAKRIRGFEENPRVVPSGPRAVSTPKGRPKVCSS